MPGNLTQCAAELRAYAERLRRQPPQDSGAEVTRPGALPRALVACRLLHFHSQERGQAELADWLVAMRDLLTWLQVHPQAGSPFDPEALEQLCALQEQALRLRDAGGDPSGTVLASRLAAWQRHFKSPPSPQQSPVSGWTEPGPESATPGRTEPWPESPRVKGDGVLVLLVPSFRSGSLLRRLQQTGLVPIVCAEPNEAWDRLRSGGPFRVLICDNLQPQRHLSCWRELVAASGESPPLPVVLVCHSSQAGMDRLARLGGAIGVWRPPHREADLLAILERTDRSGG
jgi:hypothetical protein